MQIWSITSREIMETQTVNIWIKEKIFIIGAIIHSNRLISTKINKKTNINKQNIITDI